MSNMAACFGTFDVRAIVGEHFNAETYKLLGQAFGIWLKENLPARETPYWVGVGYENPAAEEDKIWSGGGRYNFGFATLALGYSKGTTAAGADAKGWIVGGTIPVGAFDIKVGYAANDVDGLGETKKAGIGAHYNLSKRTAVYTNVGVVSNGNASRLGVAGGTAITAAPTFGGDSKGAEFGVRHFF